MRCPQKTPEHQSFTSCGALKSSFVFVSALLRETRLMFYKKKKKKINSLTHTVPRDIINVAINAAYVALTLNLES